MNIVNIAMEIFIIFMLFLNIWGIARVIVVLTEIKKLKNKIALLTNNKET